MEALVVMYSNVKKEEEEEEEEEKQPPYCGVIQVSVDGGAMFLAKISSTWLPLAGILPLRETPEGLCGSENATPVSTNTLVGRRWVNFQVWVNYPFKSRLANTWN